MQKVEGSSPFSRFKSPAKAQKRGFLVAWLLAVRLPRCRRSRIRPPHAVARNALICWPSSLSGVRRRDQTPSFLSRFRIRSGNSSRERARRCTNAGAQEPRTRARGPRSSPLQRGSTRPALTSPRVQRPFRLQASPTQQRASGLSDSSSSKTTGSAQSLALLLKPSAGRNSANPSAGGDARTARSGARPASTRRLRRDERGSGSWGLAGPTRRKGRPPMRSTLQLPSLRTPLRRLSGRQAVLPC
jgi:hypothetical protein